MRKIAMIIVIAAIGFTAKSQDTRLMRFPDIYKDQIVFSYGGDLYTIDSTGGTARKLTTDEGYEMFPHFSPDGKKIAFTASYDGNTEVYIMPSKGGKPERLTYTTTLNRDDIADRMGPNNIVMGWTPDGKNVVFRSRMKSFNSFVGQLFKAPVDGSLPEQIKVPKGSWNSFSKEGNKMVYNRVFREFRTWKHYRGGMADDLWMHDFTDHSTKRLFENKAQDIIPMWINDKIYFLSDRDYRMDIYSFDLNTEETEKLTDFENYDIKFPGYDNSSIVFEKGGEIYVHNTNTNATGKINIEIAEDFENSRKSLKDASKLVRGTSVSPEGSRIVVSGRGEIFTLPANEGITERITRSSGAHDRNPVWSPDGKKIAFWSDKSGEYQIYIKDVTNDEKPEKITSGLKTYPYHLKWSPDSKKLMWSDKKLRLRFINIKSGEIKNIKKSRYGEIKDYTWSPDSKWISYSDKDTNRVSRVYLFGIENGKTIPVTSRWYDSGSPEFSNCGKLLLFTSNRDFNPIYSQTEWNHAYRDMSGIYYITLNKKTPDPLRHKNDSVKLSDNKTEKTKNKNKNVTVDPEGIISRLGVVPVKSGSYWNLSATKGKIFFYQHRLKHGKKVKFYDMKKREIKEVGKNINFSISADKKHMLVKKKKKYYVVDLPSGKIDLKDPVDMSDMKIWVDLDKEYKQIFDEAWRQMRDFFYDPGMHGVNWEKMHDKYSKLLPWVNHRNDLTYLIGEMIGELNAGHAYVGGGDREKPDKIYTGMLGAEFEKDKSGFFKIKNILEGKKWLKNYHAPLSGIGKNISKGDYIIAIDGVLTKNTENIYSLLLGKGGKKVVLTINDKPRKKDSRKIIVKTTKDEAKLYYHKWVRGNIEKVNEATNGKVGYIHIPNMITEGLNEFVKYFYPQLNKDALIIDDRGNGGGNVSPMIIERLRRELSLWGMGRNIPEPETQPRAMHRGPKVLLVNQYSASDGDLFPYQFRKHNLGKIIGVRTWGGVVGIRGSLPFIDGGTLRKPEFAHFAADGSDWIIEGHGVEPDIEVWNDPWKEFNGTDQQLNKAIEVILNKLEENTPLTPDIPDFPEKNDK